MAILATSVFRSQTVYNDSSEAQIIAATEKTTPVDADLFPLVDSAAANVLKKLTWANLKTTLFNTGNVGIGTATPLTKLTVLETVTSSPRGILSQQISDTTDAARLGFAKARGTTVSPTTVVTGDLIGRLMFRGYDGTNYLEMGSIEVGVSGTVATTRVPTFMAFSTASDATPSVLTERMRLDNSGTLTSTGNIVAVNFVSTSDITVKENIKDIDNALSIIKQLNGKQFNFKNSDKLSYGFIAQEIEKILPDIVYTDSTSGLKSINYQSLIAFLVESIKQLSEK